MKHLQLLSFLIIITSCRGVKQVTETPIQKSPEVVKIKDTVVEETAPSKTTHKTEEIKNETKLDIVNTETNHDKKLEFFNHNEWSALLQKHVSSQGIVNYKSFKTDRKALLDYINSLGHKTPNSSWDKEAKLAYWINAYNAMTVDLILRHYPIKSIKDIKNPWEQRYWKLGKKWYNLNEIEHDILRKMDEPRIHFAIVCASFSCPKLQNEAFNAKNLNVQLTKATKEFLRDSNKNEISNNTIKLSKIFQWFSKDFKQNGSLIDFLNIYSDVNISAKAKKSYLNYSWALNE